MLQNMWQELVEAVDDRSAKGIALALSAGIDRGVVRPGERLPPIRRVARDLQVAPATISAAWSRLARAGLIETDGRRGTRVREASVGPRRYRRALDSQAGYRVDLSTGLPDPRLLPDLHAAMQRVPRDETAHSYLEEPVVPALREVLEDSWPNSVEALTVVDGAMDAHSQFVAAHLRFGDRVAVEQPCFPPLLDLLEMAGAVPLGVGYDAEGPVVAGRRRRLWSAGAKVLFFQPWGQNPSGQSCLEGTGRGARRRPGGPRRGRRRGRLRRRYAAGPPVSLGALLPERTVLVRSFSKTHGPDLRLAAIGGPATVVGPIVERRYLGQGWSSRLVQSILLELLTDARSRGLVADAQATYAAPHGRHGRRARRARGRRTGARRHQRLGAGRRTGRGTPPPRGRRHPGRERRPVLDLPARRPTTSGSPPRPSTATPALTSPTSRTSPTSPTWPT